MSDLLRAEFLKIRSTRTALGLLVAVFLGSIAPAALLVALAPPEVFAESGSLFELAAGLVPYILVVFGILGMTNEYRHGTITYAYLVTPRRARVILVKLAVYALIGAALMGVSLALVALTAFVGLEIRAVDAGLLFDVGLADLARQLVVAGLMTAFGVALGALLRVQVATVAGVLIWALVIEPIVAAVRPTIGTWLPFAVFSQVTGGRLGGAESSIGLERPEAFVVSVVYIGVVSVAAVLISMSRDVT